MKTLNEYLSLPYAIELVPDDGGFLASIPDLPGCMASGQTKEEALLGLEEVKELWMEGRLKAQQDIPLPSDTDQYSGKFVLRIPRSLHRSLEREAKKQRTSLNQYVMYLLSERHSLAALTEHIEGLVVAASRRAENPVALWSSPNVLGADMKVKGGQLDVRVLDFMPKPEASYCYTGNPPSDRHVPRRRARR